MDEFKRLLGVVALTLNKSEAEVEESVKSDEGVSALTADFKAYRKTQFDDGVKASEKKLKGAVEATLRKRGVDIASFDELESGLDTLETSAREKAGQKLTEDEVLRHPAVVKQLNAKDREKEQAVAQAAADAAKTLEEKVSAFRKEQTGAKVEAAARKLIADLNPNLNPDSAKAARQVARLVAEIKAGEYEVTETGDILPLDPETGLLRKNDAGHAVAFSEVVRGIVTAEFDLPTSTPRDSSGITPDGVKVGDAPTLQHYKGVIPETEADYLKLANDTALPYEARKELKQLWDAKAGK